MVMEYNKLNLNEIIAIFKDRPSIFKYYWCQENNGRCEPVKVCWTNEEFYVWWPEDACGPRKEDIIAFYGPIQEPKLK